MWYCTYNLVNRDVVRSLIVLKGSEVLSGQQALSSLSDNGLCAVFLLVIFSAATFLMAIPRTLGHLSWLALASVAVITVCGLLIMVDAGINPVPGRTVDTTVPTNFYQAFLAITGPVSSPFRSIPELMVTE